MEAFDVCIVGSINTDLSVFTDVVPSAGETILGSKFVIGYGGKGANQCVASQFLGSKSTIVSKIGYDCFGDNYLNHLKNIAVNTDGVTRTKMASTGAAFITVQSEKGENRIIVVPGSNMLLSPADVDEANQKGFLNARVVVCQFEISGSTTLHALQLAHNAGKLTILNPAPSPRPAGPSDEPGNFELLPQMLRLCDYCCPNETEACQLMSSTTGKTEQSPKTYTKCLAWLAEQGVRNPIVTLGAQGVVALVSKSALPTNAIKDVTVGEEVSIKGEYKYVVHIAAPRVHNVVDTTGAGDCFVGAFAHFLACQPSIGIVEQLRRAIWVASMSVQKVGTQSSFPKREDLPTTLFAPTTFYWPET